MSPAVDLCDWGLTLNNEHRWLVIGRNHDIDIRPNRLHRRQIGSSQGSKDFHIDLQFLPKFNIVKINFVAVGLFFRRVCSRFPVGFKIPTMII